MKDYSTEPFYGEPLEDDDELLDLGLTEPVIEEVYCITTVLTKNGMVALLCLQTAPSGGAICRVDPRELQPSVQEYKDADTAKQWYSKSLKTSEENGWRAQSYDRMQMG